LPQEISNGSNDIFDQHPLSNIDFIYLFSFFGICNKLYVEKERDPPPKKIQKKALGFFWGGKTLALNSPHLVHLTFFIKPKTECKPPKPKCKRTY
jgi:hypothetical protein